MGRRQRKEAEKAEKAMRDAVKTAARIALRLVEQPIWMLHEDESREGRRRRAQEDQQALREAVRTALERRAEEERSPEVSE